MLRLPCRLSPFFTTLLLQCNTANINRITKKGVGLGTTLPRIDVFCITHTHTCVEEEHVRVALEREVSIKMGFISEKERAQIQNTYCQYKVHESTPITNRVTSPCMLTHSTKKHHRAPHSTHRSNPGTWS